MARFRPLLSCSLGPENVESAIPKGYGRIVTVIVSEAEAQNDALTGQRVAIVGYGNQGRSWALNLRDSGIDVAVCVRADASRDTANTDGFNTSDLDAANDADVVCVLVPDDVIPT